MYFCVSSVEMQPSVAIGDAGKYNRGRGRGDIS